jgi:tetratricopeptide (TPR) repeat protein
MRVAVPVLTAVLWLAGAAAAAPTAQRADDPLALAQAALLRAGASADPRDALQAHELVQRALNTKPEDPRSWALGAWDEMNRHRFSAALRSIDRAHALGPATIISLGLESDALVELGRYDQALDRVQRMLDIDPGLPALSRAAHLRFLHGDTQGAIALLHTPVVQRAGERERTKIALQLAELHVHLGEVEAAEAAATQAALLLPGDAQPLAMRARIAEVRARPDEALALYLRAQSMLPSPEYALGAWRMARMLGELKVEKRQRALLEGMARLDETQGLYRRVFIEFFGAQSQRLADAQRLARLDLVERPDVYAHALMAWTLLANGERDAAAPHIVQALRLGTRDEKLRALLGEPARTAQR